MTDLTNYIQAKAKKHGVNPKYLSQAFEALGIASEQEADSALPVLLAYGFQHEFDFMYEGVEPDSDFSLGEFT